MMIMLETVVSIGIRYFQRQCNSYNCHVLVGLVFDSYVQVLGIRYFQRPCTSYHCRMSVGLVFDSYVQVLGIRNFQRPCASYHSVVVYHHLDQVLSVVVVVSVTYNIRY